MTLASCTAVSFWFAFFIQRHLLVVVPSLWFLIIESIGRSFVISSSSSFSPFVFDSTCFNVSNAAMTDDLRSMFDLNNNPHPIDEHYKEYHSIDVPNEHAKIKLHFRRLTKRLRHQASQTNPMEKCDQSTSTSIPNDQSSQTHHSIFSHLVLHDHRLEMFQRLIHIEEHPNGGAILIRSYYNDYLRLNSDDQPFFIQYFFNLVYGEINGRAKYAISVMHDAARYLPDLVDYFSSNYPKMIVKTSNIFNSKEVLTTTMSEYRNRLAQTYSHGTFRYGPLMSISLVGTVAGKEECGKTKTLRSIDRSNVSFFRFR